MNELHQTMKDHPEGTDLLLSCAKHISQRLFTDEEMQTISSFIQRKDLAGAEQYVNGLA